MKELAEAIERWVDSVYPSKEELKKRVQSGQKLKLYLGVDPTSSYIHIGHTIPLRLLKTFQDNGHEIIFLIGDFTAKIGDPSGRDTRRGPLTDEAIKRNFSAYERQLRKILDFQKNPPKLKFNSNWWEKMNLSDFFNILSEFTLSGLSERDLFQARMKKGNPIAISEFLYPILQGYDSVELDTDIEIGATDQTFNMLVGRQLLKKYKNKEKIVITTPLLEGTDGRKMSKTFGNTIDLETEPNDMYGRVMSLTDELAAKYLELVTDLEIEKETKPLEAKKQLAFDIVRQFHGDSKAASAQKEFKRVFQKGERSSNIKEISQSKSVLPKSYASLATIVGATPSVSAAINLAKNKGLKFDGKLVTEPRELFETPSNMGTIIDVGKRKSVKIIWKD